MNKTIEYKSRLDEIGITASLACAIHCVLLPLIFTTLPLFGFEILDNKFIETTMILLSLFVGSLALYRGYKKHHRKIFSLILFIAGITILLLSTLGLKSYPEIVLKLIAATCIVTAHVLNLRYCRRCKICRE